MDTLNHVLLLDKLERYGARGIALKLFRSYLYDMKPIDSLNGMNSALKNITTGIPQVSILGLLVFLVFYFYCYYHYYFSGLTTTT